MRQVGGLGELGGLKGMGGLRGMGGEPHRRLWDKWDEWGRWDGWDKWAGGMRRLWGERIGERRVNDIYFL